MEKVEILCTIYNNDGEVVERLTFKMPETNHYDYMTRCDAAVYHWAQANSVDYDDYYFGYKIISRER